MPEWVVARLESFGRTSDAIKEFGEWPGSHIGEVEGRGPAPGTGEGKGVAACVQGNEGLPDLLGGVARFRTGGGRYARILNNVDNTTIVNNVLTRINYTSGSRRILRLCCPTCLPTGYQSRWRSGFFTVGFGPMRLVLSSADQE